MNKNKLKAYAPQARKDFIAVVSARANQLGLSATEIFPVERKGDIALIAGRSWPVSIIAPRDKLIDRIRKQGFNQVMEAVAYSWFNRFAALRYMEIHDYLNHGYRVLSNLDGGLPEILQHAQSVDLPGLRKSEILQLQLAGNKDGEIYRQILLAQCNALHEVMPFLFEKLDDDTELLLPDNLLLTDSVVAKLVDDIDEEDWAEVEIIGWLYQFYISEKKDQVIGKVVKSEDIPAATQLFTPNWIVQYLVQNSVGRLWLMANPASTLASQWPYYIQPAEQTPEVQAQLDALIQTRMDEDGGSLNPETITVLDPACGSGHILVVAYDVLKAIYLERGYQARAIPRLILEKNLYGLDIDDRAAQMAGFALLMKARADDRRLFNEPPKLNVLSLQESKGLDAAALAQAINAAGTEHVDVAQLRWLIDTFEHAKTFGSLIQIDQQPMSNLRKLLSIVKQSMWTGDLYAQAAAQDVLPLVQQALVIGMQFDAVVANPPYMGGKGMNPVLKDYAKETFPDSKSDLFAMFMERGFDWCKPSGFNSMVTMQSWMFLSSFQGIREKLIDERTIQTMAHLGSRAFSEISGEVVQTTATIFSNSSMPNFKPTFFRLIGAPEQEKNRALLQGENSFVFNSQSDFKKIPGSPIAYWVSDEIKKSFSDNKNIGDFLTPKFGMSTGDSSYYRHWYEVQFNRIGFGFTEPRSFDSIKVWAPADKGGTSRRWYGNKLEVLFWKNDGEEIRGSLKSAVRSPQFFCKPHLGWTLISTSAFSARYFDYGFILDTASNCFYADKTDSSMLLLGLAALNSKPAAMLLEILNPTVNFSCGVVELLPIPEELLTSKSLLAETSEQAIFESKNDWDQYEVSWDFSCSPLTGKLKKLKLSDAWVELGDETHNRIARLKKLEEANNKIFIHAYGLQDELSPEVLESQITLARADREKDCQRLISYAIGCMMGRYSLDEPGLIYAYAGNVGFDASRYATFPADADGIVPLTDELWFTDDAASRVREFLLAVWGADTLEENMAWLAESLGTKASETSEETIRRYLADKFFKDHLKTYKNRPIYWLFSSGKQGAFQALVYLHRYHEGTLARMRSEYVVPLTGQIQNRIAILEKDRDSATATALRNKVNKQIESLRKKHLELLAFDEKIRHYADMRIKLDLDDGVKVNYGKFGDLLGGVKDVIGIKNDE